MVVQKTKTRAMSNQTCRFNLGQPDNIAYSNCANMWTGDPNFKWDDQECGNRKAFICKAPATQDGNIDCPDCGDATEPPGVCE